MSDILPGFTAGCPADGAPGWFLVYGQDGRPLLMRWDAAFEAWYAATITTGAVVRAKGYVIMGGDHKAMIRQHTRVAELPPVAQEQA